jgi:pyridoxal phosphate enzyme (YggS family)
MSGNLEHVQRRITSAAGASGRDAGAITLIAVTKGRPVAEISALHEQGVRDFAENRAPELQGKAETAGLEQARWHFIGNVQSGQCRRISRYARYVHSLDRLSSARLLGAAASVHQQPISGFLQVNMTGLEHRNGLRADIWDTDRQQFLDVVTMARQVRSVAGIQLRGLMTMAPTGLTNARLHGLFSRTRQLLDHVREAEPEVGGDLSMGMSDDFDIAIAEGATHVRLGRILFHT